MGWFSDKDEANECKRCESGTAQPKESMTECIDCEIGQYSNKERIKCVDCEVGKAKNEGKASLSCDDCQSGQFQSLVGQALCIDCIAGSYTNTSLQTKCIGCPSGFSQGSPGESSCDVCPYGTISNNIKGSDKCEDCNKGTMVDMTTDQTECLDCSVGTFSPEIRAIKCEKCPVGWVNDIGGSFKCVICVAGQFQALVGNTSCINCPAGWSAGTEGNSGCTKCGYGTISNKKHGSDICVDCLKGQMVDMKTDQTVCFDCSVGTFSAENKAIECEKCPIGWINPMSGSFKCSICDAGQFQPLEGKTSCTNCPIGWANLDKGEDKGSRCVECEAGFYMGDLGSSSAECKECSTGRFAKNKNSRECTNCPAGYFNSKDTEGDKIRCYPCSLGEYQSKEGQTSCKSCSLLGFGEIGDPMTEQEASTNTFQCVCPKYTFNTNNAVDQTFFATDDGKVSNNKCGTTLERGRSGAICGNSEQCRNIFVLIAEKQNEGLIIEAGDPQDCPAKCDSPNTQVSDLLTMPGWWRENNQSLYFLDCKADGTDRWMTDCPGDPKARLIDSLNDLNNVTRRLLLDVIPKTTPMLHARRQLTSVMNVSNGTLSDINTYDSQCAAKTHGAMCGACMDGYTRQGGICKICQRSYTLPYSLMFIIFLLVMLVASVLTRSALKKLKKEQEEQETDGEGSKDAGGKIGTKDAVKLLAGNITAASKVMSQSRKKTIQQVQQSTKQLITFGQILSSVTITFDSIPWPITFRTLSLNIQLANFDVFGWIQGIDRPDACSLTLPFIQLFYYHMALLPVILIASMLVYILLGPCFKGKLGSNARIDTLWQIINLSMFCLYPGLAQRIFQIFRCTTVTFYPEKVQYMSNDFNVRCYGDEHTYATHVAIVFMVLFVLGIPAFMFTTLYRNKHILHSKFDIMLLVYLKRRRTNSWFLYIFLTVFVHCPNFFLMFFLSPSFS